MTQMLPLAVRNKGRNHIYLHTKDIDVADLQLHALVFSVIIFSHFIFFSMRAFLAEPFHGQIHSICLRALKQDTSTCQDVQPGLR